MFESINFANMNMDLVSRMRSGQCHFSSTWDLFSVVFLLWSLSQISVSHRVEILHSGRHEDLRHLFGRHHAGHGVAVADGLPHGDDVGHVVLPLKLEGPEVGADAPEAHLDLVGDDEAPRLTDVSVKGRETATALLSYLKKIHDPSNRHPGAAGRN